MLIENLPPSIVAEISYRSILAEKGRRSNPYNVFKWWGRRFFLLSRALLASLSTRRVSEMMACLKDPYRCWGSTRGKRILDPFMGGGTIVFEALRLGYNIVGIDIDRAAELIVKSTLKLARKTSCLDIYSCLLKGYVEAYRETRYLWRIPGIGEIIHVFLSRCPPCRAPLWVSSKRRNNGIDKYLVLRENGRLEWIDKEEIKKYGEIKPREPKINLPADKLPKVHDNYRAYVVEILTTSGERKFYSLLDDSDKTSKIIRRHLAMQEESIKNKYVELASKYDQKIPLLKETKRLINKGIYEYSKLFTWRQYISLIKFIEKTPPNCRDIAGLIVGDTARTCSLLAIYYQPYAKVNPGLIIKSYWLPENPVELNPFAHRLRNGKIYSIGRGTLASKLAIIQKICFGNEIDFSGDYMVLRQDSTKYIYDGEVYAIVTDPPYPGYQSYIDMSLLYNYFLDLVDEPSGDTRSQETYNLSDPEAYIEFYEQFVKVLSRWKHTPSYYVLLISISSTKYAKILPRIINATIIYTKLKPVNIYWFIGEAPGKLGRSRTRGVYAMVFNRAKYEPTTIDQIIDNIIKDFRETKYLITKKKHVDKGIDWDREEKQVERIVHLLRKQCILDL